MSFLEYMSAPNDTYLVMGRVGKGAQVPKKLGIPAFYLGKRVEIAHGAFVDMPLEEVILHEGIQKIGHHAFAGCSKLRKIVLPLSLCYVGQDAFVDTAISNDQTNWCDGCLYIDHILLKTNKEGSLCLPDDTRGIGEGVSILAEKQMSEIQIPKNVQWITPGAFRYAHQLKKIIVERENGHFYESHGCLVDHQHKEVVAGTCSSNLEELTSIDTIGISAFAETEMIKPVNKLPASLREIKESAFWGTKGLHGIIMPSSLQKIDYYAFASSDLEELIFPDSPVEIKDAAFCETDKLLFVDLKQSVSQIPSYAFYHSNIPSITIPGSVRMIDAFAFSHSSLRSLTVQNGCEEIRFSAFADTTNLIQVELPKSLIHIEGKAFDCQQLKIIQYMGSIQQWTSIRKDPEAFAPGLLIECIDGTIRNYA